MSRVSKAPEKKLGPGPRLYSNLKVEMPILWIADESEKQLYETLKHVYGSVGAHLINQIFLHFLNLRTLISGP